MSGARSSCGCCCRVPSVVVSSRLQIPSSNQNIRELFPLHCCCSSGCEVTLTAVSAFGKSYERWCLSQPTTDAWQQLICQSGPTEIDGYCMLLDKLMPLSASLGSILLVYVFALSCMCTCVVQLRSWLRYCDARRFATELAGVPGRAQTSGRAAQGRAQAVQLLQPR